MLYILIVILTFATSVLTAIAILLFVVKKIQRSYDATMSSIVFELYNIVEKLDARQADARKNQIEIMNKLAEKIVNSK